MKICIFGGSFDPIHEGHLHIAEVSQKVCDLDQVLFLPCAQSPLKDNEPHASDEERCEMIRCAINGRPWAHLDQTDLLLPPPSWSWRVAELMKSKYPQAQLFWLIGTDQWNDLDKWGRWEYLSSLVTFIVYHRGDIPQAREGVDAMFIAGDHPASSSDIRASLKMSRTPEYLPSEVLSFISQKGLYRNVHDKV